MVNDGWWLVHWLVEATYPSEKWWSESQLGWWHSIPNCFWKVIKFHGSLNHQPVQTSHLPRVHLRIPCPEFHRFCKNCLMEGWRLDAHDEAQSHLALKCFRTENLKISWRTLPSFPFSGLIAPTMAIKSNSWASEPTKIPILLGDTSYQISRCSWQNGPFLPQKSRNFLLVNSGCWAKRQQSLWKKWPDGLKKIQSNTSVPNQEFKEIPYKVGPPNDS